MGSDTITEFWDGVGHTEDIEETPEYVFRSRRTQQVRRATGSSDLIENLAMNQERLLMNERMYEDLCRSATSAAGIFQGKWRIPILCALQGGPVRLGQLVRLMPTASKKVLGENLHQLQKEGVLVRTDFSETLLHVEYDYSEGFRSGMTAVLTSLAVVGDLRANKAAQTEE